MAPSSPSYGARIIDIRRGKVENTILDDMRQQLRPQDGQEKSMPTLLLYDEVGLQLFEDITYLEEYYLTNAEINVLESYGDQIAQRIQPGSLVIELGSGNLRKVNILLQAIEKAEKDVDYLALDLSYSELQRTLLAVPKGTYKHVQCYGLHGTYDDGLEWLKRTENRAKPKCILSLGSSIGNFSRQDAAAFLGRFAEVMGLGDSMLMGIDGCQQKDKVYQAYNDREGKTHEFIRNGLTHANKLFGREVFNQQDWEIIGQYDEIEARHQAFYSPVKNISFDGINFKAGEMVRVEESYKYSSDQRRQLWERAGLVERAVFSDTSGDYRK
ncbi:MAG: hypothetical protein M1830_009745 [Pleopsidium flavum]|nr:MAG: hypothetical protein M1830_009745 [Pleopsidium flavum]